MASAPHKHSATNLKAEQPQACAPAAPGLPLLAKPPASPYSAKALAQPQARPVSLANGVGAVHVAAPTWTLWLHALTEWGYAAELSSLVVACRQLS